MFIRTILRNTSIKTPLGICILAGAATGTLVAMITAVNTPTVHADADLSKPAAIVSPAPQSVNSTPAFLAAKTPAPATENKKGLQIIRGLASWYGGVFNGRKTASGEKFNMHELTACQPNLPFGSLVRVINRSNKRSVVVRINDRGDLTDEGRVIDLSWAAAEKLAMTHSGLAKVDVEVLSFGRPRGGK
ncbi:MAG: septal ring lytic transglycosylase RlpA family protein [Terracidiphilus sp.]